MGPLAGTALATTSNATGSGGGHGGMGSLGCGVYRWDSNYNTCACTRHFPPLAAAPDACCSLPQLRIACVEWSWRVRQWRGRWGGSGWPGRRCCVPSGQSHTHFPFVLLCRCSTRSPVLPPQPSTPEPRFPPSNRSCKPSSFMAKSRPMAKAPAAPRRRAVPPCPQARRTRGPSPVESARDISQAAAALAALSPSSQDLCWAAGALRPTVSTFGQFISPQSRDVCCRRRRSHWLLRRLDAFLWRRWWRGAHSIALQRSLHC